MSDLNSIYGNDKSMLQTYGVLPGSKILPSLPKLLKNLKLNEVESEILSAKTAQWCKRLYMMHMASVKVLRREEKFIIRMDRNEPGLEWKTETEIYYHVASMHLFARCALDSMANVFTALLLDKKGWEVDDRFFEFSQRIKESSNPEYRKLFDFLHVQQGRQWSWYRILCGTEQGRSLRSNVKFQKIARIEYLENKPENERDGVHAVIKSINDQQVQFMRIPLVELVHTLRSGVVKFAIQLEDILVAKFLE